MLSSLGLLARRVRLAECLFRKARNWTQDAGVHFGTKRWLLGPRHLRAGIGSQCGRNPTARLADLAKPHLAEAANLDLPGQEIFT